MSIMRKIAASACAVLSVAAISVIGAPNASATTTERTNRCVKVSVDYTRTGPVSWYVNSATVGNNCSPFYGHFQLYGPTFNSTNQDAPAAVGFTVTLNQNWGSNTTPSVCGIAWHKITPTYWADYGYVCVPLD
ncbi:hypothetical protein [Actinokineospora cianjurensis]|nr:hypothetical protein [Actinokineospora cianjurensis]